MGNTDPDGTEWKNKYYEAADLLAETKAELDDFQTASKDLEEELERELQRTECEKERLRLLTSKAEKECNEWKVGVNQSLDYTVKYLRESRINSLICRPSITPRLALYNGNLTPVAANVIQ